MAPLAGGIKSVKSPVTTFRFGAGPGIGGATPPATRRAIAPGAATAAAGGPAAAIVTYCTNHFTLTTTLNQVSREVKD